jgi:hypothetical protein
MFALLTTSAPDSAVSGIVLRAVYLRTAEAPRLE